MADRDLVGPIFGEAWTPSDSTRITRPTRGIQVGVGGDVALEYEDGTSCVWPACQAGILYPHNGFVRVKATGTTATTIVVAY